MVDKIKQKWLAYKAELTKKTVLKTVWHYFLMAVGTALLAFGTSTFILPYNIVTGGVSGIAIIFSGLFGAESELIITILTYIFFVLGLLLLGVRFTLKTLVSTLLYPPLIYLFSYLRDNNVWLQLGGENLESMNVLLAGIFGGAFVGAGVGLTFFGGGSSGGVDCLALALNKYFKFKTSISTFVIDAAVIGGGLIYNKDLSLALIGILSALVCAIVIDRIFLGNATSYVAFIVSNKYEEINKLINDKMERGTTLIQAEGGYTGENTKMIQVAFDRKEYSDLQTLVAKIDPKAFISIVHAHEINGYGFKKIPNRSKVKIKKIFSDKAIESPKDAIGEDDNDLED